MAATIASHSNEPYPIQWESLPLSLQPTQKTLYQKICAVAWNVLSVLIPIIGLVRLTAWGLGVLAHRLILPAMYHEKEDIERCRRNFEAYCQAASPYFEITPHTIQTPDGAELSVHLFRHKTANDQTPTTIYFGGNGFLKGMCAWSWILEDSIKQNSPMNLVVFDYRCVDGSKGTFNGPKDLLIDGSSVVQWVKEAVHTPPDHIHFYGMSLGGAIALKTKAADESLSGNLLHERSFSSLEDWIQAQGNRLKWFLKPLVSLAIRILKQQDFELDAVSDLRKLKGRILVVHHPYDPVIPYGAGMARKIPDHSFELKMKEEKGARNHHCEPLESYIEARERLSSFLFAH